MPTTPSPKARSKDVGLVTPPAEYVEVFAARVERLTRIRKDPTVLPNLKKFYADNPWQFIDDWGMTYDPRVIDSGGIPFMPFNLWPRQVEYVQWLHESWLKGRRGLVEKSRDCGVTWLSGAWAVTQWLFRPGFAAGFGSRKEDLVDQLGDPKSIFEKIRTFIDRLPVEFLPREYENTFMRCINADNGATIIGESGDNIGRGGRCSVYFVDEAAHCEHQEAIDKALSANTKCQIDISSVNGPGNEFYKKRQRFNNTPRVFIFDWRDDPRKDQAWYDALGEEHSEATIAQEVDRDYTAAVEDVFLPGKWVRSAIDAHIKLGFTPTGLRVCGFDPADTGDAKGLAIRHGAVLLEADQLKTGEIQHAIPWAFALADQWRSDALVYDGDGMGAPVMKVSLQTLNPGRMRVLAYHGSGAVVDPGFKPKKTHGQQARAQFEQKAPADMYLNYRAQTWSWFHERLRKTHDAIERAAKGQLVNVDPDELISISSKCKGLHELVAELSTPKRTYNEAGKIQVESKKMMKARGVSSPNLADAVIMAFSARAATPTAQQRLRVVETPTYDAGVGY